MHCVKSNSLPLFVLSVFVAFMELGEGAGERVVGEPWWGEEGLGIRKRWERDDPVKKDSAPMRKKQVKRD